ncbi:HAMP domain-containing sensor histidine kinase [Bdellovibrionota bacterium FG-1]
MNNANLDLLEPAEIKSLEIGANRQVFTLATKSDFSHLCMFLAVCLTEFQKMPLLLTGGGLVLALFIAMRHWITQRFLSLKVPSVREVTLVSAANWVFAVFWGLLLFVSVRLFLVGFVTYFVFFLTLASALVILMVQQSNARYTKTYLTLLLVIPMPAYVLYLPTSYGLSVSVFILGGMMWIRWAADRNAKNYWSRVTENLLAQQREKETFQAARLASVAVLAGGLAHEINNPLTILKLNNGRLKKFQPSESPRSHEYDRILEQQSNAINRVNGIVQSLLTIISEKETRETFNVHSSIRRTTSFLTEMLAESKIQVEYRFCDSGAEVQGDSLHFQQIIMSLLKNAKDAIQHDQGLITITTTAQERKLLISFRDNGAGIDPQDLPKVFDPFFTTKAPGKGLGLELTLSHSIVRKMNGKMSVISERGQGTEILIELPLVVQPAVVLTPPNAQLERNHSNSPIETLPDAQFEPSYE